MPTLALSDDIVNILLIGLDSRSNLRGQNTDVLIVVGINKDTKQVTMLSIPRDLWVYIPTYGWSRINTAHRRGYVSNYPGDGPGLLMRTIEVNFGLPIDHWARIDFEGFARVVDELGGVDMTVACPVNLRYRPPTSDTEEEMLLEPGVYHMDGATALRYVRTRRGGSDFDRAHRQHQFLRAMWDQTKDQLKGLDIVPRIRGLWSALKNSIETDLNLGDILSLAPVALDLEPQRIRSRYIGPSVTTGWTTHDGWQVLLPQYDRIQQLIANLYAFAPTSEDEVARENARIQVRNGTYRQQLAQIAADQLRWEGLNVVDTGLADNPDYQETQIIVFNDKPKAVEKLSQVLAVKPRNVIYQPDPNQPADILVILGNDYDPCR
jgi:LCP family protein required for cell wall assembly